MSQKILIVEDDPFAQQFYSYFFARTPYEAVITENGEEILDQLSNGEISLLILDINLKNTYLNQKKTDGVQIAKYVRSVEDFRDIPILLVTAYQDKIGNDKAFDRNIADDYILKPINDFDHLINKIKKLIEK